MKRIFILTLGIALTASLYAVPAYRGPIEKTQADGSTITVYQHGDEHFHYYTLADGTWVKKNAEGMFEKTEPITTEQLQQLRTRSRYKAKAPAQTEQAYPLNIAPRGLIILVNFKDVKFQSGNTLEAMKEMHNGDNYTYNGATGSARQYFIDQSKGQYKPQFDVVGPVTLSKNMAYYGENIVVDPNDPDYTEDAHVEDLVQEACKLADTQCGVDYSKYDNNGDGEVDFVYFVYAGVGEADSEDENTIWPHAFWLSEGYKITLRLDGKLINTYACSAELNGETKQRSGVGTFCHEFGHVLGLPDLYDTNGANHTLSDWDIMDYGSYNNDGKTPPCYSAYERFFLGWLTPTLLNEPATVRLPDLQSTNACAIITKTGKSNLKGNDPNPTEFYILENRQQTGWDTYLPGHGMLVTKIQYSYNAWMYNYVNSKTTMYVDIIEAKNNYTGYGRKTDAFPEGGTSFTPYTDYYIRSVTENNGIISFDFSGGGDELLLDIESAPEASEERVLAVYNIMGQIVATNDLSALPQGIYIVKTTLGTKKIAIR